MYLCSALFLLVALPALAGGRASGGGGPAFARRQQRALLARVGDSVALRCRVLRLADRAVSWVRSSDLQILTHAGAVFTADSRVSCSEEPWQSDVEDSDDIVSTSEDDWDTTGTVHTLNIHKLRVSDSGRYECQVNTEPKLSLFFNLTVLEDAVPSVTVRAVGGRAARVLAGGLARLACEARYEAASLAPDALAALPPLKIRWEHNGETLDPQSNRGGISLDTERWAGRVVSRLTLGRLQASDAGRYSCSVGGRRAHHTVLVDGEELPHYDVMDEDMEAMQRDQAAARTSVAQRPSVGAALLLLCTLIPLLLVVHPT